MNFDDLITPEDLAEKLHMDLDKFHVMRRRRGWPCVKFGRTVFRFTPAQVEQIIAMQTVTHTAAPVSVGRGRRRS